MIATINPAGCGGRQRHLAAAALFSTGALASAALLGALCGLAGMLLGGTRAALLAAAVALLGALRETALPGLPLPQLRRQVPERWRRELPLALWPLAYGAGLGAGVLTFQPVATLWVALAAAASLADPLRAALCLAAFGAARAALATLPGLRAEAAERALVGRTTTMRRLNAVALVAVAALLVAAAPAPAATLPLGSGSQLDPAISDGVLAYTQRDAHGVRVVIEAPRRQRVVLRGASTPSLEGPLVAVHQGSAVRVLRWADGSEVARVEGALRPALRGGTLAFVRRRGGRLQLVVQQLASGRRTIVASVTNATLSRPSLHGGRIAWTVSGPQGSALWTAGIDGRRRHLLVRTRVEVLGGPALGTRWLAYTETGAGGARLLARRLRHPVTTTLLQLHGRVGALWTTAIVGRTAYVTRWSTRTGLARIVRLRF